MAQEMIKTAERRIRSQEFKTRGYNKHNSKSHAVQPSTLGNEIFPKNAARPEEESSLSMIQNCPRKKSIQKQLGDKGTPPAAWPA